MTIRKSCACGRVVGYPDSMQPPPKCVCGRKLAEQPDYANSQIANPAPLELGDRVERQLRRWGITEEWYTHIKQRFGLAPTCGCQGRKRWLNRVSKWWRERAAKAAS